MELGTPASASPLWSSNQSEVICEPLGGRILWKLFNFGAIGCDPGFYNY